MSIDWNAILNGTITFVLLIVLRALLDLRLAHFVVKWFSWLPLRNYIRAKPTKISGQWDQIWASAESASFESEVDRHGHPDIKQLGSYCYGEFISKNVTYVVFGRIIGDFFVGDWYDKKDPKGYFGAFQLEVLDSKSMKGLWVGHSKTVHKVKGDEWVWNKIS
ncbi:MAG: hypothetical protein U9R28_00900 [Pseudomonadota bacterium]|nr:hypothetical protein [Pseudomonadota bacterium]